MSTQRGRPTTKINIPLLTLSQAQERLKISKAALGKSKISQESAKQHETLVKELEAHISNLKAPPPGPRVRARSKSQTPAPKAGPSRPPPQQEVIFPEVEIPAEKPIKPSQTPIDKILFEMYDLFDGNKIPLQTGFMDIIDKKSHIVIEPNTLLHTLGEAREVFTALYEQIEKALPPLKGFIKDNNIIFYTTNPNKNYLMKISTVNRALEKKELQFVNGEPSNIISPFNLGTLAKAHDIDPTFTSDIIKALEGPVDIESIINISKENPELIDEVSKVLNNKLVRGVISVEDFRKFKDRLTSAKFLLGLEPQKIKFKKQPKKKPIKKVKETVNTILTPDLSIYRR